QRSVSLMFGTLETSRRLRSCLPPIRSVRQSYRLEGARFFSQLTWALGALILSSFSSSDLYFGPFSLDPSRKPDSPRTIRANLAICFRPYPGRFQTPSPFLNYGNLW